MLVWKRKGVVKSPWIAQMAFHHFISCPNDIWKTNSNWSNDDLRKVTLSAVEASPCWSIERFWWILYCGLFSSLQHRFPRLQMGEEQAGVLNWARAAKWARALYLLLTVQQLCKRRARRFTKPMPEILSHTTTNVESAKSLCRIKPICYCWNTCLWIKLVFKNALDTSCEWALSNSKLDMHFLSVRDGVLKNVLFPQIFCREGEQTISS